MRSVMQLRDYQQVVVDTLHFVQTLVGAPLGLDW